MPRGSSDSSEPTVRSISRASRSSTSIEAAFFGVSITPSSIFARSASISPRSRSRATARVSACPATGTVRVATTRPSTHRQSVVLRCPMSASIRVPGSSKADERLESTSPSASTMRGERPASPSVSSSSTTSLCGASVAITWVWAFCSPTISQSTT